MNNIVVTKSPRAAGCNCRADKKTCGECRRLARINRKAWRDRIRGETWNFVYKRFKMGTCRAKHDLLDEFDRIECNLRFMFPYEMDDGSKDIKGKRLKKFLEDTYHEAITDLSRKLYPWFIPETKDNGEQQCR